MDPAPGVSRRGLDPPLFLNLPNPVSCQHVVQHEPLECGTALERLDRITSGNPWLVFGVFAKPAKRLPFRESAILYLVAILD